MLTYDLKKNGKRPLYEQLYAFIRKDIINGTISPGDRLPSKRSLADHLNVSITTVENAYSHLRSEGYVETKPNRGFFVSDTAIRSNGPVPSESVKREKEQETEYDIDFHGNLCSIKLFPISVWAKMMRQVLSDADSEMLRTIPWNGLYVLREAICDYLRRYKGITASPDRIIIGAGTEYLYSRLLQLLGPGAILAYEDPGYKKLSQLAAKAGIMHCFIPTDQYGMSVEKLKESSANVVHVSPGNQFPTGAVMPEERRRELLKWSEEILYRYIVEDDYDSEFVYKRNPLQTLFSMDKTGRVIYMNTFSKSLVPALRISYMVLPKSLYQLYRMSQDFYSCTVSSFDQITLSRFISDGYFERHLNRLQKYYRKKQDDFYEAIQNSKLKDLVQVEKRAAGTHLLIRVRSQMSDDEIRSAAEAMHVHLTLLADYCQFPRVNHLHTLVVNYSGMESEDISHAVKLLEKIFEEDILRGDL